MVEGMTNPAILTRIPRFFKNVSIGPILSLIDYKAELSSLSAQTKLMPLRYKK
jgi:hypothetical protein